MAKALFDWELIRREYSTAQFTDSELSKRHGCSRQAIIKRKNKEGWTRDNSEQVRLLANARMIEEDAKVARESYTVTPEVTGDNAQAENVSTALDDEQREIELAVETRIAVLRSHRKDLQALKKIEEELARRLLTGKVTKVFCYKGEIVSQDFDICDTDLCAAYNQLTSANHKRLASERIAFNMDDKRGGDDNLPTVIVHDPERGTFIEGEEEDGKDA